MLSNLSKEKEEQEITEEIDFDRKLDQHEITVLKDKHQIELED